MRMIDADKFVIEELCNRDETYYHDTFVSGVRSVMKEIVTAPTVDAVEVVRGHWIMHIDDLFPTESTQECSVCHEHESITLVNDNFCPNCGAKMMYRGNLNESISNNY